MASHWSIASTPAFAKRRGRFAPSTRRAIRPASSRTFRCWEIAGCVMSKGLASSSTVASPFASWARIARRVGSASAEKATSRFIVSGIDDSLYKKILICQAVFYGFVPRASGGNFYRGVNPVLLTTEPFAGSKAGLVYGEKYWQVLKASDLDSYVALWG